MNEYISRRSVYKYAKDMKVKETGAFSNGYNKGLRDMMSAVMNRDAIPTADIQLMRWIPVTEDLPVIDPEHHVSKDVIVRVEGGGYMFSALEENIFGQAWFECERMSPSGDDGYTVTHWMPLLPLPEDVDEDMEEEE